MFSLSRLTLACAVMMFVDALAEAEGQRGPQPLPLLHQQPSSGNSSSRVEREANYQYYHYDNGLTSGSGYGTTGTRYATRYAATRPIQRLSARTLLHLLSASNASLRKRHPGVSCVPVNHCVTPYGTKPEHFSLYGYVAPADYSCYSMNGLVLCVDKDHGATTPATPPTTTTSTTTTTTTTTPPPPPTPPASTGIQLPCVHADNCRVRFNHGYYHSAIYGQQQQCPQSQHVPCITWHPTSTPTPTMPWHPTPAPTQTPINTWHPAPTPTQAPTIPWHPTPTQAPSHPWHPAPSPTQSPTIPWNPTPSPTHTPTASPTQNPSPSHPHNPSLPYNSVQIIGPRPIYVTLSKITGPQVLNLYNRNAAHGRWATST